MKYPLSRHIGLILIACICNILPTAAQFSSWESFAEQLYVEAAEHEGYEQSALESLYEEYCYLHAHPININSADSTELQALGFLAEWQIEGIHHHIYKYGAILSVGELMLIPELDYHTRQLLSYFVTFGPMEPPQEPWQQRWRHMLTEGRSELTTRMDIPLYQRAGYAPRTLSQLESSPSHYYMGNAIYHNLRYNYHYGTDLSWGICTEKDAGEPLFGNLRPLPDHLSGYLQIGDQGVLKNLILGNYRLRCGLGLVMNSNFASGKTMLLQGIGRMSSTVTPHRGTGEAGYYTGAAATWAWRSWEATTFASYRKVDATLDGAAISTLKTDGYHRTPMERAKWGNTRGNLFGVHIGYAAHGIHLGLTGRYQSFNRNFAPPTLRYKHYAPRGHSFTNASADYAWHHHRISLLGETAVDGKGAMATLNLLKAKVSDQLYITLLQRYYAHDYWALEAKSMGASSEVRNERGLYLGAEWQPHQRLQLTAYADAYHFPFLRYRVSAPSYGSDGNITLHYTGNDSQSLMLRYRYRLKQRDVASGYRLPEGGLLDEWAHRLKLQWEGSPTHTLSIKIQAEGCLVTAETRSTGYMGNIQAAYEPITGVHLLSISGGITAFSTDYATRIYGYERGLLYAYNYRMYNGRGIRSYLLLQYAHKQAPRLTITAKLGHTHYLDRDAIGSGAAMIDTNHQEDIQLQARYTFRK